MIGVTSMCTYVIDHLKEGSEVTSIHGSPYNHPGKLGSLTAIANALTQAPREVFFFFLLFNVSERNFAL